MNKLARVLVVIGPMIAVPAIAQTPGAAERARIAGTVQKLDGDQLRVNEVSGRMQTIMLSADAKIYGVEKRRLSDIRPGDFVASGGVRGTDGQIHAVELRIFSESMRGVGEGQRPWDLRPEGVMTNATVGTVSQMTDGGIVHVTYKGGESEYVVGPDVPVLAYVLADRTLLKTGAAVVTIAGKQPDGSLLTSRVTAEKDGVKPPM
jgi:hypothetical protein